jgi:integrase
VDNAATVARRTGRVVLPKLRRPQNAAKASQAEAAESTNRERQWEWCAARHIAGILRDRFSSAYRLAVQDSHARQYDGGIRRFVEFAGDVPLDEVEGRFDKFRVWIKARGESPYTAEKHLRTLNAVHQHWRPKPIEPRKLAKRPPSCECRIGEATEGSVAYFYRETFAPCELSQCSPRTRHNFASAVAKFAEFSGGHTPMADLTPDRIEAFYDYARKSSSSRFTAKRYAQQLRRLLATYRPDPYSQRLRDYYRDVFRPELAKEAEATTYTHYNGYLADFLRFAGQGVLIADVTEELLAEFRAWCSRLLLLSIPSIDHRWWFIRRIIVHWRPKPTSAHATRPARNAKCNAPEGSLLWLLEARYLPERNIGPRTEEMYRWSLRTIGRFLGRVPMLADLNKQAVNDYLVWSEKQPIKTLTVKGRWSVLRVLWRYAWDNELIADLPRGIRKLRIPPAIPTAWTPAELTRLLVATQSTVFDCWTGREDRLIHVGRFLNALVRLSYDAGLRRSDLLSVTWDQLQSEGRLVTVIQKTQQPHVSLLRPATMLSLAAVRVASDNRLLPWPWRVSHLYPFFRRLLAVTGLPGGPRNGLQKLRRTSATWLEAASPGSASWHLGHSTPTLARQHYLDPRYAAPSHLPPAIPEPPKLLEGPTPGEREERREDVA